MKLSFNEVEQNETSKNDIQREELLIKTASLHRHEPTDLLHERHSFGHGIAVLGERFFTWNHADLPEFKTTTTTTTTATQTTDASQTSSTQSSSIEAGHRFEFSSNRRSWFLRQTGKVTDRGENGSSAGQGNGAHANGGRETKAETKSHHGDGAIQSWKSGWNNYIFLIMLLFCFASWKRVCNYGSHTLFVMFLVLFVK